MQPFRLRERKKEREWMSVCEREEDIEREWLSEWGKERERESEWVCEKEGGGHRERGRERKRNVFLKLSKCLHFWREEKRDLEVGDQKTSWRDVGNFSNVRKSC